MNTRLSSLAALVVTFAALALGGCAADGEEPDSGELESSSEAASEPSSTTDEGTLTVRGFNYDTTKYYYHCDSNGRVVRTMSLTFDAYGWVYSVDHQAAGGVCTIL